jgi:CRISPR-associated protein Csb3
MTELVLGGAATSALTHFAMYGLANILESECGRSVRIYWRDSNEPTARVAVDGIDEEQVAAAVHQHADRCTSDESWMRARIDHGGRADTAAFSPRIKIASDDDEWEALQQIRREFIDKLVHASSLLDLAMIGGLGEPAYWRFDKKDRRPDHGSSRWEMKARNKGEEFVGQRLLPLAKAVAARNPVANLDGLTGGRLCDELGAGNPRSSQTSTGFTQPGPVDCAVAWCALWGIVDFPLAHHVSALSVTPAAFPVTVLHPKFMVLPVVTRPVTAARMRSLLASGALRVLAEQQTGVSDRDPLSVDAATRWLKSRGAAGTVVFPILKTGSDSAPQRFVLDGRIETFREIEG